MNLRPFFTYVGGKYKLAPKYPPPLYKRVCEPFAGAAGYSVRYPHREVILYDLDEAIVGTWSYLIGASEEEILGLPLTFDGLIADLPLCQEAKWFLGYWMGKARATPGQTNSQWNKDYAHNGKLARGSNSGASCDVWGLPVKQRVAYQLQFIRHWKVKCESYKRIDCSEECTWFVDPPYQVQGTSYRCGSANIDYEHLGNWCSVLPGQVIVCEGEGADWLPFTPFVSNTGTAKNTIKELVWYKERNESTATPAVQVPS